MKKYEFTGETKKIGSNGDITLKRIRAIASFDVIKAGDLGGWIEKEENLSQENKAWVCGNAKVYGNAKVFDNAKVCNNAEVYGNAKVYNDTWVYGNVCVCNNAEVYGNAKVYGNVDIYSNAKVCGDAQILYENHLLVIGPIGSRNSFTTFFRDKDNEIAVKCGCFCGKIDKFIERVQKTHGDGRYAAVYRAAVEVAKIHINLDCYLA
ncbi:polymer-forming cytoskeletal protein [Parablautia intestinalis]|uniref:Polymer-forming cytoskeletal protein n=1 Tax=Parablautia intestinalis TaxID=2320100 RepID=A0A3A9AGI5_9FIRM|nr:polymer-forming cytoskeletal protein [Parablautia intestinalis]RKI90459.1 polymer-forming cytoskeletal protein [Parablautia intestinalis]